MPTNSKYSKVESASFPNSGSKQLDRGPKIAVHVVMEGGAICSSSLALSDRFQCFGADASLLEWLERYSEGSVYSALPLYRGSPFDQRVYRALCEIPFGKTISYQGLAVLCGAPKAARAIGNACGRNLFPLFIPCHRVIRSDGGLGGFASDIEIKRRLLEFEKVSTKSRICR